MEKSQRTSQLLLLNSLTCGLEICVAAGITYVPPLLLEAGVEEKFMTMVLGIGPVLGLIFVPLIGSKSDHWTSKYGRRRPFIWALCLGVLLSLFVIPHASRLAAVFSLKGHRIDVAFLIIGICLLDFCGQVCFTPLEALLSDMFHDTEDCRRAFSMYSFMISLGGCIGYLLTAIDWERTSLSLYLGGQEECLFTLLAVIFIVCVLATCFVAEEIYSVKPEALVEVAPKEVIKPLALYCCSVGPPSWRARHSLTVLRNCCTLIPRLYPLYGRIPKVIRHLVVAEFYSWMALMTFMMFYTDFIGEGLYHGVPNAEPGSEARVRYDEGVRMGSLGLFLQCAFSIFCSAIMDRLVKRFGSKTVYLASVAFFTFSAVVMCLSRSVVLVTIMSALTGFTYSTLQILPYTLNSLYHKEKQVFFSKHKFTELDEASCQVDKKAPSPNGLVSHKPYAGQNGSLLSSSGAPPASPSPSLSLAGKAGPPLAGSLQCEVPVGTSGCGEGEQAVAVRGICLDLAILDSAFLLSQVIPSLLMGTIVQFTQSVNAYMVSAAGFGAVAIYFATNVVFDKSDLEKYSV
ncbi:solute carrier family 45 member 3 [Callorhinchus milii]|uniref:Solute carrier family 45 member 3 n=1 Tax=Callorhinchus milii TaxID=7868 RepID=A0A4W3H0Y8_CALMI|nr:solute carrier family 45 member 3 [Callorhinchus milii]|eukprot:gi/632963153/ref/XP_007897722.1/ PREDICTED: solute carrier family 45 member 3 [Callorhinchus milii]